MDEPEFERRLQQLIAKAREANVPIVGTYSVRSPDADRQDYNVELTRVTNRSPSRFIDE